GFRMRTPLSESITVASESERVRLSFAQQRLWVLSQLEGASQAYHMSFAAELLGRLDVAALRQALNTVVTRHEVLRTMFGFADGQPMQYIKATQDSYFHLIECDLKQDADAAGALERLRIEESRLPFDLKEGPLIRGR